MKTLLLPLLLLLPFLALAQAPDTLYLNAAMQPIPTRTGSSYFSLTRPGTNPETEAMVEIYYLSGTKKEEKPYSSLEKKTLHGVVRKWHENGQPEAVEYFVRGERKGPATWWHDNGQVKWKFHEHIGNEGHYQNTTYFRSGQLRRREVYLGENLVEAKCFTATGQDTAYFPFEVMPQFPGGDEQLMKYLGSNIKYPRSAFRKGIQGLVAVQYTVTAQGRLEDIRVLKSLSPELDEEAMRVVRKMPLWSPGRQDGEAVPVLFTLPIRYTIH